MNHTMLSNARNNMIAQQFKTCGIQKESVLNIFSKVPREDFVPEKFRDLAFSDCRIPLNHDQTMMTPLEEATIIQGLNVQKHHTILEIGTGTGYLTALLAQEAKHVISIDYYSEFTQRAAQKLAAHHIENVTLITGDGIHGYMDKAPYDIIVLTGSIEHLDRCFHSQLLQGGRLFAVIGKAPAMEGYLLTLDEKDQWQRSMLFETSITPLINRFKKPTFQF